MWVISLDKNTLSPTAAGKGERGTMSLLSDLLSPSTAQN